VAISLSKGQRVSLEKETGKTLDKIVMGLGWDVREKKGFFGFGGGGGSIDLDASVGIFDGTGKLVDQVWYSQLKSKDGSILHTGDNLTGAGDGDDEQIIVNLGQVPAQVQTMVFVVSSFSNDTFDEIENAYCRMVDAQTSQEILRYALSGQGSHTAQIMMSVYRKGSGWSVRAIGEKCSGRQIGDLITQMTKSI
jgi:tellurium resistance protein TerZ